MLSFRDANVRMKIVAVTDKGKYSQIKGKSARKDKQTDEWYNSTWNFINFVGDAHKKIDELVDALDQTDKFQNGDSKEGVWIVLKSVGLENASWVDDTGTTRYPKNYRMTVFSWKFVDEDGGGSGKLDRPPEVFQDESDDEFPF
jgi:hypothetical protein